MNDALLRLLQWSLAHRPSRGGLAWRPERFAGEDEAGLVVYGHLLACTSGMGQEVRYQEFVSRATLDSSVSLEVLLSVVAERVVDRLIDMAEEWIRTNRIIPDE